MRHTLAILVTAGAALHAAPAAATVAAQPLVVLDHGARVHARPDPAAPVRGWVARNRPITGTRSVLPVAETRGRWLRVRLPGRPNGSTGWIRRGAGQLDSTPWRVLVETRARRVTVLRGGVVVRRLRGIVGAPATPTPHGRFFVEEAVRLAPGEAGGRIALALSARSSVLRQFAGGPGQIALHGLDGVGGTAGTAVSHGCVRLANAQIRWLARRVGPGVPVQIRA